MPIHKRLTIDLLEGRAKRVLSKRKPFTGSQNPGPHKESTKQQKNSQIPLEIVDAMQNRNTTMKLMVSHTKSIYDHVLL